MKFNNKALLLVTFTLISSIISVSIMKNQAPDSNNNSFSTPAEAYASAPTLKDYENKGIININRSPQIVEDISAVKGYTDKSIPMTTVAGADSSNAGSSQPAKRLIPEVLRPDPYAK